LIDEDTWLLAQVRKGEFKRPTLKYDYALGSALRCVCGAPLRGHPGPGANRPASYRYYQCPNYSAHGGKMKHHRTDLIDAQFIKLLQQLTADHDLLETFVANAMTVDRKALMTRLSSLRRELSTFESRRRAIFEAYEMQTVDKIALAWRLDDLRKGEVAITEQAAEVEDQLAIEKARRIDIAEAKKIVDQAAEIWLSAPNDEQRAIAKGISTALGVLTVTENGHLFVAKNALAQTEKRPSGLPEQTPDLSRDLSAHDRGMRLRDRGRNAN
jgi:site-specific DNA recombinase